MLPTRKPSPFICLICSAIVNGSNTFHQSAATEELVPSWHITQAISTATLDPNNIDNFVTILVSGKYRYKDTNGWMVIEPHFDNIYDFFDGLAAIEINGKWCFIDGSGHQIVTL